ncbi:hypothetical protein HanHA89_Chr15g0603841 [Helianthus annuus]|nr:hypothetical protein HanHA89_Chr15g0603841 [Helianthus annuus]
MMNEPNTPLRSFRYVKLVKQCFVCCSQSLKLQYYVLLLFLLVIVVWSSLECH